jgi:sporulation protein YlmC with PRC-barrel domain
MTSTDDLTRPRDYRPDDATPDYATGAAVASETLTTQETGTLISADKVQGTAVYNRANERLGTVDQIMLNKRTGVVAYAVMSFGGFLGIGERYHMLPWRVLTYDVDLGGYCVDLDLDTLKGGPTYSRDELNGFDYDEGARSSDSYYGSTSTYPLPSN